MLGLPEYSTTDLSGLNSRIWLPHTSRDQDICRVCSHVSLLASGVLLAICGVLWLVQASAFIVTWLSPCVCAYVQISSPYKDTSHTELGSALMNSLSKLGRLMKSRGLGLQHTDLGWGRDTISFITFTNGDHWRELLGGSFIKPPWGDDMEARPEGANRGPLGKTQKHIWGRRKSTHKKDSSLERSWPVQETLKTGSWAGPEREQENVPDEILMVAGPDRSQLCRPQREGYILFKMQQDLKCQVSGTPAWRTPSSSCCLPGASGLPWLLALSRRASSLSYCHQLPRFVPHSVHLRED